MVALKMEEGKGVPVRGQQGNDGDKMPELVDGDPLVREGTAMTAARWSIDSAASTHIRDDVGDPHEIVRELQAGSGGIYAPHVVRSRSITR